MFTFYLSLCEHSSTQSVRCHFMISLLLFGPFLLTVVCECIFRKTCWLYKLASRKWFWNLD